MWTTREYNLNLVKSTDKWQTEKNYIPKPQICVYSNFSNINFSMTFLEILKHNYLRLKVNTWTCLLYNSPFYTPLETHFFWKILFLIMASYLKLAFNLLNKKSTESNVYSIFPTMQGFVRFAPTLSMNRFLSTLDIIDESFLSTFDLFFFLIKLLFRAYAH